MGESILKLEESSGVRGAELHNDEDSVAQLDLKEDHQVRKLYLEHPYFLDVLRWMNGEIGFSSIQHFHHDRQFRSRVLPDLKTEMFLLGLLKFEKAKLTPAYKRFVLQNVPSGPATQMVLAGHVYQSVLRRAGNALGDLKVGQVRTKATKEQVSDWMMKLNIIYSEISSTRNDSEGDFVTFASLVTIGE